MAPSAPGASPEEWFHFSQELELSADLLPVVSNRQARVSPDSKMKDIGKTPSIYNRQRFVAGMLDWTQHTTTPAEIAKWSKEPDYGICIQTRHVRAIDVDTPDADEAESVRRLVAARVVLPERTRPNSSKFLLAFTYDGDLTKRRIKTAHGIIELLATGQQFIAVGTHPSGVRYEWDGGLPSDIPVLSAEEVESLWADLQQTFGVEDSVEAKPSNKREILSEAISTDPVAIHLRDAGLVLSVERDGRMHITCPFEQEHTTDSAESATTYWPAHTGGFVKGHFHCLHAHCEHRSDQDFLDQLGFVDGALLSEFDIIGEQPTPTPAPTVEEPEGPRNRFEVIKASAFVQRPPMTWLIKNVIPDDGLVVVFGESGAGKSFLATDLAYHVSAGAEWRGNKTKRGRVTYICAEGVSGFRNRLLAIAQQNGIDIGSISIGVIPNAPNMMEKADAIDVAKAIVAAGGSDLVIVDTFAQVMPGANENSGEDVGRALLHCKGIHRATGATVMLIHHAGKDTTKGARGWSGLRAAADAEIEVVRVDEARSATVTKMKDGEDGAEFPFRLLPITIGLDEDGDAITSCVVEHTNQPIRESRHIDKGPKGTTERLVMRVLGELAELGDGMVSVTDLIESSVNQLTHDPATEKRDTRRQRVTRAIDSLRDASRIVVDGARIGLPTQGDLT